MRQPLCMLPAALLLALLVLPGCAGRCRGPCWGHCPPPACFHSHPQNPPVPVMSPAAATTTACTQRLCFDPARNRRPIKPPMGPEPSCPSPLSGTDTQFQPLPTRPVFGPRLDGREAGEVLPVPATLPPGPVIDDVGSAEAGEAKTVSAKEDAGGSMLRILP